MVLDFFYPPHCPICEKYIENRSEFLCIECSAKILAVEPLKIPKPLLKEIWRLTRYKEGTREILHDLKFNNSTKYLPAIKKILDKVIMSKPEILQLLKKIDVAVAVPLHTDREKERGYNQVELIFNEWLTNQNIAVEKLLLRTRATNHLYDKNADERKKELAGAFATVEGAEVKIKGKRILILDDIVTTGATMSECAEILKSSGASEIYGLALASDN